MNVHVPQTNETKVEALEVMMVPKMIVSPQANKPVIGNRRAPRWTPRGGDGRALRPRAEVQDTLLACRIVT